MAKANINDVIYALDTFADGPNSDAIDLFLFYKLADPELEKTRKQILSIIEEYPAEPGENL